MKKKKSRSKRCLIGGCNKPVKARGLCSPCRCAAWRSVLAGTVTEQELVERGLLLPLQAAGPISRFDKELAASRKKARPKGPTGNHLPSGTEVAMP